MTPDALAGLIGTLVGAAIGVIGTVVGALGLARRDERRRARQTCLRLAAIARPLAVRLFESSRRSQMPIEGFGPTLDRFTEAAMSEGVLNLTAAQLKALQNAVVDSELAIRHINNRFAILNDPTRQFQYPEQRQEVWHEISEAATGAFESMRTLLESLGDDEPVVARAVREPNPQ